MIVFAIIYLLGANVGPDVASAGLTRLRILSLAGLLAIAGLLFLGIISPYYAIVAVPTIPACALFLVLVFRPVLSLKMPKVMIYLKLCVAASALTWAFQLVWELRK
jgi:hypothetical protein